jgi:hypothetical protein
VNAPGDQKIGRRGGLVNGAATSQSREQIFALSIAERSREVAQEADARLVELRLR